jgi:hypothetical protein
MYCGEVIRMARHRWIRTAARCAAWAGFFGWTAAAGGAPRQPPRETSRASFDLAVEEVDVRQVSSTPMFREVEIRCVVANRGPKPSSGPVTVVISRPGDDKRKVLKRVAIPESLAAGEQFEVRAETAAWFATPVAYRCELHFGTPAGGDADPNDDYGESTYPKI